MSRLVKEVFKMESGQPAPFGLCVGQMRRNEIGHNVGWYNKQGEKLGWGDLNAADFTNLTEELQEGELFVVLGEQDSYWKFVSFGAASMNVDRTAEAPGPEYVAAKCRYIIQRGKVWLVDAYSSRTLGEEVDIGRGNSKVHTTVASREEAHRLLGVPYPPRKEEGV